MNPKNVFECVRVWMGQPAPSAQYKSCFQVASSDRETIFSIESLPSRNAKGMRSQNDFVPVYSYEIE